MLTQLAIHNLRNVTEMSFPLTEGVSAFIGPNGAGKTTILDAVHILGTGKPFTTSRLSSAIQQGEEAFQVVGRVVRGEGAETIIGVKRRASGGGEARIARAPIKALSQLVYELPLILINADALDVLRDGPDSRRRFIDKFAFHVEQSFLGVSQRYQQALRQRNALLRGGRHADDAVWVAELSVAGELVHEARVRAVNLLSVLLAEVLCDMKVSLPAWQLSLRSGWSADQTLSESLTLARPNDRHRGYTQVGPHRGDLAVLVGGRPAQEVLSRGQMKVLVAAMRLAQGRSMRTVGGVSPVLLVDDVAAELDAVNAEALFRVMSGDGFQVLATMIDQGGLSAWTGGHLANVFHVERGAINVGN